MHRKVSLMDLPISKLKKLLLFSMCTRFWNPKNYSVDIRQPTWHNNERCKVFRIWLLGYRHYRHFKRHLHLKWPVVHQQLHVIRNTAHRLSTLASYTASRVRPKRKISCAAAQIAATQIAATLTISFPRWRHMSLTSYWGQRRMSLTSYPRQKKIRYHFNYILLYMRLKLIM